MVISRQVFIIDIQSPTRKVVYNVYNRHVYQHDTVRVNLKIERGRHTNTEVNEAFVHIVKE